MGKAKTRIFVTGGTIDNVDLEKRAKRPQTYVPQILKIARVTRNFEIEALMLKDSREIMESDRKLIAERCKKCKERKIIIAHGTFTMEKTAKFLGKRIRNKTIILTGSMVPFIRKDSDAMFNLGSAVSAVQVLPNGVYIVMNGEIFTWRNVRKNIRQGIFERSK